MRSWTINTALAMRYARKNASPPASDATGGERIADQRNRQRTKQERRIEPPMMVDENRANGNGASVWQRLSWHEYERRLKPEADLIDPEPLKAAQRSC